MSAHLPCCARKGESLSNAPLLGNTYAGVRSRGHCCHLCHLHPHCTSWVWRSNTTSPERSTCALKQGRPHFEVAAAESGVTTFAGSRAGHVCRDDFELEYTTFTSADGRSSMDTHVITFGDPHSRT